MYLHFIEKREHKEAFLELARRAAASDGFVNRNEWNYLQGWKLELGMEDWEPSESLGRRSLSELIGCVREEQVRNIFLLEILLVIYADGNWSEEEERLAAELQASFGYSDAAFALFREWVERLGRLRVEGVQLILDPVAYGRSRS